MPAPGHAPGPECHVIVGYAIVWPTTLRRGTAIYARAAPLCTPPQPASSLPAALQLTRPPPVDAGIPMGFFKKSEIKKKYEIDKDSLGSGNFAVVKKCWEKGNKKDGPFYAVFFG